LGIMVGRGSSPVTFDTRTFQKRLETIAGEFGKEKGVQEKIDLKFYEALDRPVAEEGSIPRQKSLEIIPKKEKTDTDTIPLKTSKKKETFNIKANQGMVNSSSTVNKPAAGAESSKKIPVPEDRARAKKSRATPSVSSPEPVPVKKSLKGGYTIQIAAYKAFKDAVTQMALLETKGFSSYRVKAQKNGVTWYRVRTGSFSNYDDAKQFMQKIKKARINAMIVKKEDYENIKK